eukprot:CAMPEP_0117770294 /NCGR_PEP_ID=MMETSP0947-20121206/23670_1 /TAXON_ID=44440 /ORGANISM="Chattonella subsalsa, Strain CCMP2191" /LENGTH=64 /DNA_ID=CAMNT_0005595209 /DNA_START=485 /DNA_END=679 /DNA_ORIENTATION=+
MVTKGSMGTQIPFSFSKDPMKKGTPIVPMTGVEMIMNLKIFAGKLFLATTRGSDISWNLKYWKV